MTVRTIAGAKVTVDSLKRAAGTFPTGVVIVAANTADGPAGLTLQSFVSLSLDPPLVHLSVSSTSGSWQAIKSASGFAVSVLAEDQADLALNFGKRNSDKFAGMKLTRESTSKHPKIEGAVAWFDCVIVAVYPGGDHDIVVASVLNAEMPEASREPLVFHRSGFWRIEPAVGAAVGARGDHGSCPQKRVGQRKDPWGKEHR
ncbi:flavin reductase family protein [Arthrobacter sp. NPDC080031]|uniref:flavin reductase family protein n=1 Tax=Arthrobacter sp. NPDC080031 TaxID=3155918 RepID=UPI00344E1A93